MRHTYTRTEVLLELPAEVVELIRVRLYEAGHAHRIDTDRAGRTVLSMDGLQLREELNETGPIREPK